MYALSFALDLHYTHPVALSPSEQDIYVEYGLRNDICSDYFLRVLGMKPSNSRPPCLLLSALFMTGVLSVYVFIAIMAYNWCTETGK